MPSRISGRVLCRSSHSLNLLDSLHAILLACPSLTSLFKDGKMSFVERLESRELLSAVNISHGAIIVTGSDGNDALTISPSPGGKKLIINYWEVAHPERPVFKIINSRGIKKIQIDMRGGNDSAGVTIGKLKIRVNIKG